MGSANGTLSSLSLFLTRLLSMWARLTNPFTPCLEQQDPVYEDLRAAIYENEAELQHFRQLVVNIVLATDIFDKHMKSIRDNRWDKAFQQMYIEEEAEKVGDYFGRQDAVLFEGAHLKATIGMWASCYL